MQGTPLIEVGYKDGVADPAGDSLAKDCRSMNIKAIRTARISQLYRFAGRLTPAERDRIAKDLLTDPVIQESRDGSHPRKGEVSIDVWFKAGVTDVVGDSVLKGVRDLKISSVESVRTGYRYRLPGVKRKDLGEKIAMTFLVNPLVQDYVIHAH